MVTKFEKVPIPHVVKRGSRPAIDLPKLIAEINTCPEGQAVTFKYPGKGKLKTFCLNLRCSLRKRDIAARTAFAEPDSVFIWDARKES